MSVDQKAHGLRFSVILASLVLFATPGRLAGQGLPGREIHAIGGESETVVVPMVAEGWSTASALAGGHQSRVAHPIGHFPGFKELKQKANDAAKSYRALQPKSKSLPPARSLVAPTSGVIFDGPSESNTPFIPPDPVLAAGPSHVVVAINSLMAIYDKSGVQQGGFQDLKAFFSSLGLGGEIFDPRIMYDQTDSRFILSAAEGDMTNFTSGNVLLAVSQTPDPTGAWNKFAIDFKGRNLSNTANTFPDFPTLGLSSSAVYISTSQFVLNSPCLQSDACLFSDTWIKVIGLSELLSGNPALNITTFKNVKTASGVQAFAIQPTVTYGASSQEFLVAADYLTNPSSKFNLFSINTSGIPTLTSFDLAVSPFSIPPDAPQIYWSSRRIATNDFRLLNAVWQNNSLWCAQNVADRSGSNAVVRWYEINLPSLATAAVKQSGDIAGVASAYYPAVAVQADETVEVVFSTSSLNDYVSAAYTGRAPADPPNMMRPHGVYKAGTSTYDDFANRWGDYSGASLDPAGDSIWLIAEYASLPDPHFATAVTQVSSPPALEISPPSLDFGGQNYGTTSTPQALTLLNKGASPLTVSRIFLVQSSGSGNFAVVADNCSGVAVPAGGTCAASLTFTPNQTGVLSAPLAVSYNPSGSPPLTTTVPLTGVSIAGIPTVSPNNVNFSDTPIRSASAPKTVTLTNTGNAPLGILRFDIPLGDYAETNDCPAVLSAGSSCAIQVTFRPSGPQPTENVMYVFTTGYGGPAIVELTGVAVEAPLVVLCPPTLTFSNQTVATTSAPLSAYLSNTGTSPLSITRITTSGDFAQRNTCGTSVSANNGCTIDVTFTPTASGTRSGTLTIADNAPGSPNTIILKGAGVTGTAALLTAPPAPPIPKVDENSTGPTPSSPQGLGPAASANLAFARLPLRFEANNSQLDRRVRFLSRGEGYTLFLMEDEAMLVLQRRQSSGDRGDSQRTATNGQLIAYPPGVLRMRLAGINPNARVSGLNALPGKSNYFIGSDPAMWRTNITNYSEVRYSDVYPGIDLVYYGNNGQLEYDLFVAPGADPHTIRLEIENGNSKFGKRQPRINADGDLVIETEAGEFRFRKPVVYQVPLTVVGRRSKATDNRPRKSANNLSSMSNRQFVDGRFELRVLKLDNHDSKTANPSSETENLKYQVSFEIASYDPELPLVIDPVLTYSTFLGGGGSDRGNAITVDANGNAYIAGTTYSSDFPTANAFQATSPNVYKFQPDAFVAKLDPSGTTLLYSTYLGGSYADEAHGIAVDTAGNTYITGITSSKDFPVLGGFQSTHSGGYYDAFVTKLNPTGSAIVYSTYLGGSGDDEAQAIALDSSGSAYVAGFTGSEDFPTTVGAFQRSYQKNQDAFVAKLNTTGSALVYSTYLGGARADSAYGLALDAQGNAYVTGGTTSVDFPATPGAFQTGYSGYFNTGFVAKLNPTGTALVFSSHLGGTNGVGGIAVDASGSAYVTGSANPAFPTSNAFQNKVAGGLYEDAFVTKFHPAGCALVYSTFLGGTYYDKGLAIAVDSGGRAYVAGYTASTDFPLANPIQSDYLGGRAFVAEFTPSGNAILFSTYYGGAPPSYYYGFQPVNGIAVDSQGNVFVTGQTVSEEFPTLGGAQGVYGGGGDAFVAKISPLDASAVSLTRSNLSFGDQPVNSTSPSQTVLLRNMGSAALAITTIEVSGEFAQTNTCGNSVTGGTSCSISITFNPTSAGGKTGTVAISDNASGSPHLITLSGNGIDAPYGALSTSNLDFGTVIQGTTVPPKTVTLTNSGNRTLNVATIELANRTTAGVFTQTNNCATTLPPGASCTISVTLNAAGVSGGVYSSITISDDAPNSPQVNYLLAIVVRPPKARLEGVGVQVASVVVGNTYPIGSAILANDGDLPLIISRITTSQDFTQDNPCPSSLAPQSYCQILLSFAPKGWGLQNGALTVTDNAADSPQNLALSGRGLDFTVSVSPASATVTAGQSASYTLTVAPLGGFDQAVSLGCSGTPSKATCSITPSYVTPDGTNVVTAAVTVPTSARSTVSPKLRKLPIGPWIGSGRRLLVYLLWLVVLGIVAIWPTPRRKCRPTAWLSLAGAVLVLLSWTSCGGGGSGGGGGGGGGGNTATPPGTYTLTVTATYRGTGGTSTRSTSFSLTVN